VFKSFSLNTDIMKIEDILLTKEEIKVNDYGLFNLPIHPRLLDEDIELSYEHESKSFLKSIDEWKTDLTEYNKNNDDEVNAEWIERCFLKKGFPSYWESNVLNLKNGFASSLSINRNHGGTIYYLPRESEEYMSCTRLNFSPEKLSEFRSKETSIDKPDKGYVMIYRMHNIDHYPGALFLRNWGINYLNNVMTEILE